MNYGRTPNILQHVSDDIFYFAPVPLVYHQVSQRKIKKWHDLLIQDARDAFSDKILEVPDVRHINELGSPPNFNDSTWAEDQLPAVGIWHSVPTNNFLNIKTGSVDWLRSLIEERYLNALSVLDICSGKEAWISESWIQFYKNGDDKVLHNHERYGPPYPDNRWAGAYYIDDGEPDSTMPYSGVFSFRVRQTNYYIRPIAGLLLIWSADILHQVHPFYGERERIVINFNINTK